MKKSRVNSSYHIPIGRRPTIKGILRKNHVTINDLLADGDINEVLEKLNELAPKLRDVLVIADLKDGNRVFITNTTRSGEALMLAELGRDLIMDSVYESDTGLEAL